MFLISKQNLDKRLQEVENTKQRIAKKEKEIIKLKEKLTELNSKVLSSILEKNDISITELVETVSGFYSESEQPLDKQKEQEENKNG